MLRAARMGELWRSFLRGVGGTLGVAQVRRRIESPEESVRAVLAEIREAYRRAVPEDVDDSLVVGFGQRESAAPRPPGMRRRSWPGHCQACGAVLNPPDATDCRACYASDTDE